MKNEPRLLKVSKSQKQNCRAKTSSKNERTNLFFYPDGPEILETWNQNLKFQVIPDCQDRKTNSSVRFWKKFFFEYFAFEIYWPLVKIARWLIFVQANLKGYYACLFGSNLISLTSVAHNIYFCKKMFRRKDPYEMFCLFLDQC